MKHYHAKHGPACGARGTTLKLTLRLHLVACARCRATEHFKRAKERAREREPPPDDSDIQEDLSRDAWEAEQAEEAAEHLREDEDE